MHTGICRSKMVLLTRSTEGPRLSAGVEIVPACCRILGFYKMVKGELWRWKWQVPGGLYVGLLIRCFYWCNQSCQLSCLAFLCPPEACRSLALNLPFPLPSSEMKADPQLQKLCQCYRFLICIVDQIPQFCFDQLWLFVMQKEISMRRAKNSTYCGHKDIY